ncbi:MAG: CinA family protein, partial [Novosphingobium sp.]|nr:CinA family protein [Novosphingobium sp.]
TAWAMAQGALAKSDADVAIAISGVAGPDGGTERKPVGTVTFARCIRGQDKVDAEERMLDGSSRAAVRHQATLAALELLLP